MKPRRVSLSRRLATLLRVLVSALLIAWIVRQVDWAAFWQTVRSAVPSYLALSLLVSPLLVLISAVKWRILLRAQDLDVRLAGCFHLYLIGYFFNNFLPTNVGGDVVRGFILGRRTGRQAVAMASVFLERFTGVTALTLMALGVLPFGPRALYDLRVGLAVATVVAVWMALLWIVVDRRFLRLTRRWAHLPLMGKVIRLQEAIEAYRGRWDALAWCMGLSILFYLVAALNVMVSVRAFGPAIDYTTAVLLTPVILLISLLPFTLGGLGLSEWAYLFALGKVGVPAEAALSAALLMRLKNILLGLSGGVGHAARREAEPLRRSEAPSPAPSGAGSAAGRPAP